MWASWAQGPGLALSHKQVAQGPCTKFSVWWSNEWTSRITWGPSFSSTELFWNRLSVTIFRISVECFYFYCHHENCWNLKIPSISAELPISHSMWDLCMCLEGSVPAQMILCSCVLISSANLTWLREAGRRRVLSRPPPVKRDSNSEEVIALRDWTFLAEKLGLLVKSLFSYS